MNIDKLFDNQNILNEKLNFFLRKKHILKIEKNNELVLSFLKKAKHNFEFYKLNKIQNKFNDWLIVILYYSLYHSALALITNKKYSSKNHYATILILIKEYSITKKEANLINNLSINKEDAELYTNLKIDRHYASYQTNKIFSNKIVNDYENQVLEFIQKTQEIIQNEITN
jgi:uncharacterized protein (UPF0332 family)